MVLASGFTPKALILLNKVLDKATLRFNRYKDNDENHILFHIH